MVAYELIANTNSSFFLTGRAGTGKTTFLRKVQRMVDKQFITLAPTGVAAILAGGDTIHSFFGLPMDVCTPGTMGKMSEARIQTLLHTDTIIIDEVSMVRCDIIDAIDYTMRKTLRSMQPFGGKQVIFVGDMFQLPPVVKQGAERELMHDLYHTDDFFFYKADVIKRMRLVKIEFQKVYRQEDEAFLRILENVRLNKTTPENLMHLNERVCQPTKEDGMVITLASLNRTADGINQKQLAEIEADAVNVLMGDVFDMSTPDAKVLYSIAMLNELHIGDPGLNLMQELIKAWPKYNKGILSLRHLMKRKGLVLVKTSDDPRELVDDFNSDMPEEEFSQKLVTAREKAPKAVEYLLRLIKKQVFKSESTT